MRAKIIGTGSCLPDRCVTNEYLSTIMDTSDEWLQSRTGIRERHLVSSETETTLTLAVRAAKAALEDSGTLPEEIDLILVATVSSDFITPSTACMVQRELGARHAAAFDINAACSGFLFALNTADAYFQAGIYQTALIIGVETLSKIIEWSNRSTCVLFGDWCQYISVDSIGCSTFLVHTYILTPVRCSTKACLKNHSCHLHPPLSTIFASSD